MAGLSTSDEMSAALLGHGFPLQMAVSLDFQHAAGVARLQSAEPSVYAILSDRIWFIEAENRIWFIENEDRIWSLEAEDRILD